MAIFDTNEEYFKAVRDLASELKRHGNEEDSAALYDGFRCINGLTDGWADHLDSLLMLEENRDGRLSESQQLRMTALCDAAYQAVHRKRRNTAGGRPWWKFWQS